MPLTANEVRDLMRMPYEELRVQADEVRRKNVGDHVFVRGIIEFSNICICNCKYCGLRRANTALHRYTMTLEEITAAADAAVAAGVDTVVLQSGENPELSAENLSAIILELKRLYPSLHITLSVGERSREDYAAWRAAGAERFLIKHETANPQLYANLHPGRTLEERLNSMYCLSELGYQLGSGFIIGIPGQTEEDLIEDVLLMQQLNAAMCGVGPFVPQTQTPFADEVSGSVETTLRVMAILRLALPRINLPATTALATLEPELGQRAGLQAGGNVLMPSFTPVCYRGDYRIYDNKKRVDASEAKCIIESVGRKHALH